MRKIKGISKEIIDILLERSTKLGQGRSVGVISFIDEEGYISRYGRIIDGGLSGLPFRKLLAGAVEDTSGPLIELIEQLPENAVIISTSPGKTGIIISTGGISIFNRPVIKVGIKNRQAVGVGIMYPEKRLFELASVSEIVQLDTLSALDMEEEREAMRKATELKLKFLDISEELPVVEVPAEGGFTAEKRKSKRKCPESIKGIRWDFINELVGKSTEIEQGREIAAIGLVEDDGYISQAGDVVIGGMGYVPSRILASSYQDISSISLIEAYSKVIPPRAVIVHTHPGGTGVMHMGDAMAVPGTWGRPIVAIGHDKKGEVKGATVIEFSEKLSQLADEYEDIEQHFFHVNTQEEESKLRKRRYQIAQEFTDLCREIEIKDKPGT